MLTNYNRIFDYQIFSLFSFFCVNVSIDYHFLQAWWANVYSWWWPQPKFMITSYTVAQMWSVDCHILLYTYSLRYTLIALQQPVARPTLCVLLLLVTWCRSLYWPYLTSDGIHLPESKHRWRRHAYFPTFFQFQVSKKSNKTWLYGYVIIPTILKSARQVIV